jgi:ubiquitin
VSLLISLLGSTVPKKTAKIGRKLVNKLTNIGPKNTGDRLDSIDAYLAYTGSFLQDPVQNVSIEDDNGI